MNLQLYYGDILVGDIVDAFCHQDTWFGSFTQVVNVEEGALERRVCDFMAFCSEWHRRLALGADCDASDFDQFQELLSSGLWFTRDPDGAVATIDDAPSFADGEVSWRLTTHASAG